MIIIYQLFGFSSLLLEGSYLFIYPLLSLGDCSSPLSREDGLIKNNSSFFRHPFTCSPQDTRNDLCNWRGGKKPTILPTRSKIIEMAFQQCWPISLIFLNHLVMHIVGSHASIFYTIKASSSDWSLLPHYQLQLGQSQLCLSCDLCVQYEGRRSYHTLNPT